MTTDTVSIFTDKEAATYLKISAHTLRRDRCGENGPPFVKLGRSVRYLKYDLDQWLQKNRQDQGMKGSTSGK